MGDADVVWRTQAGKPVGEGRTDAKGIASTRVPVGDYRAEVTALGRGTKSLPVDTTRGGEFELEMPTPGYVVAAITDDAGEPIPCKVQFIGKADTASPDFGPDSAIHGIRNVYYTADGKFRTAIGPGQYDVIVSHGPEYEAVFTTLDVAQGKQAALAAKLKRVVDTKGWLSADFHSHATPSGDNTSSQRAACSTCSLSTSSSPPARSTTGSRSTTRT